MKRYLDSRQGVVDYRTVAAARAAVLLRSVMLLVMVIFLLPACSNLAGPDYQRPDAPVKEDWSDAPGVDVSPQATIQPDWWTGFGDPYLNELINRAIAGNLDIKILSARTGVAKAAISQAEAGLLPTLSGGLGTDTTKSSGSSRVTQYSAASDVIWEADIWGKVA